MENIKKLLINKISIIDIINIILTVVFIVIYTVFYKSVFILFLYFIFFVYFLIMILIKKYKKININIYFLLLYIIIVPSSNYYTYSCLYNGEKLLLLAIIISIILPIIVCKIFFNHISILKYIAIFFMCFIFIMGNTLYMNNVLDDKKEIIMQTEIKEKIVGGSGIIKDYDLYFDIKNYNGKSYIDCCCSVSKKFYNNIEIGDKISIAIKRGFFNIPYYYIKEKI